VEPIFEKIRSRLSSRTVGHSNELGPLPDGAHDAPDLREAAVLVPLFLKEGQLQVLLTLRSSRLTHHPGQIAFPGGVRDPGDADLSATAIRETEEEIGLGSSQIELLGPLDRLDTVTGFRVSPFTAAIPYPHELRPEPAEIARILLVPLASLLAPGALRTESREYRGVQRSFSIYAVSDPPVWGATAHVLRGLMSLIGDLLEP
jgi:8-oxo-dGTP pyrophosphatase MutT (NUDIX family)